jgi:nucleotide-binding universal stress UspA family protein
VTGRKVILSGIDLGFATENIIGYTSYVASKVHGSVRLLYVIDYLLTPPSYLSAHIEEERMREESEIARWKDRLNDAGVETEYRIVFGRLREALIKGIEETSPELLVIGYKSHPIRPSSSERLIKSLHVPMLVVRGKCSETASIGTVAIKRILCPVDFSKNAGKAVYAAKKYAALFSSELHVIHIIPSYLMKEKRAEWEKMSEKDRELFDDALHNKAKAELRSLIKDCAIAGDGEVFQGNPGETISSVAGKDGYDLIVMGARGLSYVESILIGGTTDAVLKSSPCPVLVVH